MRTDVNAYDCTRGCTDTVRESALNVDWEKNRLPHRGTEPASTACRSDALPTELHPHPSLLKLALKRRECVHDSIGRLCFFFFSLSNF